MKNLLSRFALGLNLGLLAMSLCEPMAVKAQIKLPLEINIDVKQKEPSTPQQSKPEPLCPNERKIKVKDDKGNDKEELLDQELISKTVSLYYLRKPDDIKTVLEEFIKKDTTSFKNALVQQQGNNTDLILYGCKSEVQKMERIIATLDIPLQGITMEMWGIQISSSNPEKLSRVMIDINQEIDKTQSLMKATYRELEKMAIAVEVAPEYKDILENDLGYLTMFQKYDHLSIADILLFVGGAKDPDKNARNIVENMEKLFEQPQYKDYVEYLEKRGKQPFERFLRALGLEQKCPSSTTNSTEKNQPPIQQNCQWGNDEEDKIEGKSPVDFYAIRGREALLRFAIDYGYSIQHPNEFDGQRLQETSEALNSRLQLLTRAINQDVEDLFLEATLEKIQQIVRKHRDVEYAVVGKTSVASLDGSKSIVTSTTVSSFEENPPLRLGELINDAAGFKENVGKLLPSVPESVQVTPAGASATASLEATKSIVSVLAALSEDRSSWRALTDGVSLDVTPNILRNASSAELNFDINFGPKEGSVTFGETGYNASEPKVRPLSRIAQQTVKTSVYVDTFDLFALSTFNSQTTKDGGRSYIPVIGTIWKGVFSGIPVFGDLFSWKNRPQNVHHQSIILTNSFIVPTSMSLAILYQPNNTGSERDFNQSCKDIINYLEKLKETNNKAKLIDNICPRFKPPQSNNSQQNSSPNFPSFTPPNYR